MRKTAKPRSRSSSISEGSSIHIEDKSNASLRNSADHRAFHPSHAHLVKGKSIPKSKYRPKEDEVKLKRWQPPKRNRNKGPKPKVKEFHRGAHHFWTLEQLEWLIAHEPEIQTSSWETLSKLMHDEAIARNDAKWKRTPGGVSFKTLQEGGYEGLVGKVGRMRESKVVGAEAKGEEVAEGEGEEGDVVAGGGDGVGEEGGGGGGKGGNEDGAGGEGREVEVS